VVRPVIEALGEARSNREVFRQLALQLDLVGESDDDDLGSAGALLEVTSRLPHGLGQALSAEGPVEAPAGGRPVQFVDVQPGTRDGRVHLAPPEIAPPAGHYHYTGDPRTDAYPLSLISPASEHTISSTLGQLRPGIARLKIHPDDAHPRLVSDGDAVRIFNDLGEVQCEANVTPEVRPGTVSLPKGLWTKSTYNGSTSNALVPDSLTDIAGGACFNDARVQVELFARH
jgi:anaerobic selenocysteine-containing dehydrogenase